MSAVVPLDELLAEAVGAMDARLLAGGEVSLAEVGALNGAIGRRLLAIASSLGAQAVDESKVLLEHRVQCPHCGQQQLVVGARSGGFAQRELVSVLHRLVHHSRQAKEFGRYLSTKIRDVLAHAGSPCSGDGDQTVGGA